MRSKTPRETSPERRRLRAKIGGERFAGRDTTELEREYRALAAEEYITELLATAPPLTVEQRARLAGLLAPGGEA